MSMCLPVQALSRRYFLNCSTFRNKVDMKGGGERGVGYTGITMSRCPPVQALFKRYFPELLNLL